MGLKTNNFRDNLGTYRFFGATLSNGANPYSESLTNKLVGGSRNIFASNASINSKSSKPSGARHPVAWQMPQKAGGLASHNNTNIDLDTTGFGVLGLPTSGSTTITFTVDGTGGLIVSGSGTATIAIDATGTILSIASGSGTANITLSTSALIGALANLSGDSSITLTPSALIAAIGYMEGLSTNESEFSADNLARAVWDALAANHNLSGTMGEKLHNASSAGDPWGTTLPAAYPDGSAGQILGEQLLKLSKLIRNLVA